MAYGGAPFGASGGSSENEEFITISDEARFARIETHELASDEFPISDASHYVRDPDRTATDDVSVNDSTTGGLHPGRDIADSISVGDSVSRGIGEYLSDGVGIDDTAMVPDPNAPIIVGTGEGQSVSSLDITLTSDLPVGTAAMVVVGDGYGYPASATGITDLQGNEWNPVYLQNEVGGDGSLFVFVCNITNLISAGQKITVDADQEWDEFMVAVIDLNQPGEYILDPPPLQVVGSQTGTEMDLSLTPGFDSLVIGAATFQNTQSPDAVFSGGLTLLNDDATYAPTTIAQSLAIGYLKVIGSEAASWSIAPTGNGYGAAIILAPVTPPPPPGELYETITIHDDIAHDFIGAAEEDITFSDTAVWKVIPPVQAYDSFSIGESATYRVSGPVIVITPPEGKAGLYEFILCETPNFANPFAPLKKLGTLAQAKSRQYQLVWNRAGSASFTLQTADPMAALIFDGINWNDIRGTVKKCIRIRRNGVDIWSGPIWGIQGALQSGTITFNCVGWMEELYNRLYWGIMADYSNQGYGTASDTIAFDFLNTVSAQDPAHPILIQPGSVTGPMPVRNRAYATGQNLGDALQELSDSEAGFNWNVDPVTRALNLSSWDTYTIRPQVRFGYKWGPGNLSDVQWAEDPTQMVNFMSVQSQGAPVYVEDSTSISEYGRFEQSNTISGAEQSVLEPYGMAELAIFSRPLLTWTLIPYTNSSPYLFEDYQIGDLVSFSARKDFVKITNAAVRVFGATVSIDDSGNESISQIQTTAPSAGQAYQPPSSSGS